MASIEVTCPPQMMRSLPYSGSKDILRGRAERGGVMRREAAILAATLASPANLLECSIDVSP